MSSATRRRRPAKVETFTTGPFKGTRTTDDIGDDPESLLADATNLYNPDPEGASGYYARPGMALGNSGNPLATGGTAFRGQGIFSYVDLSGTVYNFCVVKGKLYRMDAALLVGTDVTPVGITIDAGIGTRVYGTPFGVQFIVTDGVNRPWLASNLSATPITGTYIQFNAANDPWKAFGPAVVYAGSVFFILASVNAVACRSDIAWSLAGDAATGYQQTNYDFRWTLLQTGTTALTGLAASNTQLYYFRERAIGSLSGIPGPGLRGQATHDQVAQNVGTLAPQSIVQFGDTVYFTDAIGRPYRFQMGGGKPEPIWLQMRGIVAAAPTGAPGTTRLVTTATFEPTLNLYLVAIWSPVSSQQFPCVEGYMFDARTGIYFGRFLIGNGCQLDTLGSFTDGNGRGILVVLGSAVPPVGTTMAVPGYLWTMNGLTGAGDLLTTEDAVTVFWTTEDGLTVTTEGQPANWQDNGATPVLKATTTRIGYDEETVLNVDRVSALLGTTAPCQVSIQTAAIVQTLEGTPTPSATADGIHRLVCGTDGMQGRGVEVTVQPTTALEQWSLQSIVVRAVASRSNADEV